MRESRLSGSVEGVMSDHDSYSDCWPRKRACILVAMWGYVLPKRA